RAAPRTVRALERLSSLEVRQDVLVVPAVAPETCPLVIVGPVTAHPQHRVDRAAATDDATARPVVDRVVPGTIRLGAVTPVVLHAHLLHADGDPDERTAVSPSCFEEKDATGRIL